MTVTIEAKTREVTVNTLDEDDWGKFFEHDGIVLIAICPESLDHPLGSDKRSFLIFHNPKMPRDNDSEAGDVLTLDEYEVIKPLDVYGSIRLIYS